MYIYIYVLCILVIKLVCVQQSTTTKRASNKGKSVLQEPVIEQPSRTVLLDMSRNRKRKTGTEREVIVEQTTDVYEDYFQNGRIYQDWDELSWMGEASNNVIGQPSNNLYQGDLFWGVQPSYPSIGQTSNNLYQGDALWGGQPSNTAINLNSYPESSNAYHLDDF